MTSKGGRVGAQPPLDGGEREKLGEVGGGGDRVERSRDSGKASDSNQFPPAPCCARRVC